MFVDDRPGQTADHNGEDNIQSCPHVRAHPLIDQQSAQHSISADMVEIVLAEADTSDDSQRKANDEVQVELVHHGRRVQSASEFNPRRGCLLLAEVCCRVCR